MNSEPICIIIGTVIRVQLRWSQLSPYDVSGPNGWQADTIGMKNRVTGLYDSGLKFPLINIVISTGISVMTTIADEIITNDFVYASGWNSFPSWPVSKNTGRNPTRIINSEKKIALRFVLQTRWRCRDILRWWDALSLPVHWQYYDRHFPPAQWKNQQSLQSPE